MTSIIDTLLTMAHADSGAFKLNRAVFPLMDIVEESVGVVGVLAEEKKQTIRVGGDTTLSVSADRGFLRMAIINLLDNAVKYSPPGSPIDVDVQSLKGEAQNARYAKLVIKDQGPGIPASEASRVFDRFYRLDEARNRDAGGAGLGLAIARWSVEAHGGQILLDRTAERGAAFAIHLPSA